MKLVITESQFKYLVSEQVMGSYTPDNSTIHDKGPAVVKGVTNYVKNLTPHDILAISALAAGILIPPPGGLAVAAVIGVLDAYQYKTEKDNRMAGLTLMLAALPLIGGVVAKIPGVKQLGTKGMTLLADKMAKGVTALAPEESAIVLAIKNNLPFIQGEYQGWVKKTADTIASKAKSTVKNNVVGAAYNSAYNKQFGYKEMVGQGYPEGMARDYYGVK
jgi:hypothetical protein